MPEVNNVIELEAEMAIVGSPSTLPPTLLTLPAELHLEIFEQLDSEYLCSSLLLGLTCKKFYAIHFKRHGKSKLSWYGNFSIRGCVSDNNGKGRSLDDLLAAWMGHRTVCYTMNRGGTLGMTMHLPAKMRKPENKGVDREDAARKKVQE
ncbi:hypothetical protein F5882DRAFT_378197 [Hyaloscypha sp. PMI_1271]|nr:hypothetical protein F5882DRAFT_378197 [Hyaloscypha sp. PMI_1271]